MQSNPFWLIGMGRALLLIGKKGMQKKHHSSFYSYSFTKTRSRPQNQHMTCAIEFHQNITCVLFFQVLDRKSSSRAKVKLQWHNLSLTWH
mmetsp:Transcript_39583/g.67415  ORF Transcript_39583/g.67415 Transcript_39583/m.67415 type:complete len:90 (-) Transcript_39583:301-570(-)